jgi:hypothetical protein
MKSEPNCCLFFLLHEIFFSILLSFALKAFPNADAHVPVQHHVLQQMHLVVHTYIASLMVAITDTMTYYYTQSSGYDL